MEHFKQELIAYLDYYNNHRIKANRKGLRLQSTDNKPSWLRERFLLRNIV